MRPFICDTRHSLLDRGKASGMDPGTAGDQEEYHERSRAFIGGFDFGGWEEEEEEEERAGGGGVGINEEQAVAGGGGTSKERVEFIEQSHGENAGSLSPIMSLRRCALASSSRGRSSSPPRRSASPLRLQNKGQHMFDDAKDSVRGSNGGTVEDDIDVWRCASDDEDINRGLLETFLVGLNTLKDDFSRFPSGTNINAE
jgi:hypothetical protein